MSPQKSKLVIRKMRYFSEELKRKIVNDLDNGTTNIQEVASLHEVTRQTVYQWIYRYSDKHTQGTRMIVELESESKKNVALLARVAELERAVGQKQLERDYLAKVLELASEHYGEDLKKNFGTTP